MKNFLQKEGTRSVLASLISILIGLVAGSVLILIVGLTTKGLGLTKRMGRHPTGVLRPVLYGPQRFRRADLRF